MKLNLGGGSGHSPVRRTKEVHPSGSGLGQRDVGQTGSCRSSTPSRPVDESAKHSTRNCWTSLNSNGSNKVPKIVFLFAGDFFLIFAFIFTFEDFSIRVLTRQIMMD